MIDLVEFLEDKEMVKTLNLRKNNIENHGAIALANFLINKDDTMISINLNRNEITNDGVEKLLNAIH